MPEYSKTINILFVLPNFGTGGSEKLVLDLVQSLDRSQFSPTVCVFFSGAYEKKVRDMGIPFYVVHPDGKKKSKIQVVLFLNQIMKTRQIHIVNTHHTSTLLQGLLSFKLFNKAVLIHTEHTRLEHDPGVNKKILKIQKFFLKHVDVALGISQGVCDYFEKEMKVPRNKIVKILNGVDIKRFTFSEDKTKLLRKDYRSGFGFHPDDVVIGMCANFRAQKNHKLLVRAFATLNKKYPFLKLVLAGDSPERGDIQQYASSLGVRYADFTKSESGSADVLFLGSRHDVPELMKVFDIYCLPSFFEGLPFSVLEAMAAGLPVVATDVEGNRELIRDNVTGYLVESNNEGQLTAALEKMINDKELCKKFSEDAVKYVQELSFSRMIQQYQDLFRSMAL